MVLNVTTQSVIDYLSKIEAKITETAQLIRQMRLSLAGPETPASSRFVEPAVLANRLDTYEYLVCLEDGAKVKMLRRYLRRFGLTPEQYRTKWGLPADYPMIAPAYSKVRSQLAKEFGLGTKTMRRISRIPKTDADHAATASSLLVQQGSALHSSDASR